MLSLEAWLTGGGPLEMMLRFLGSMCMAMERRLHGASEEPYMVTISYGSLDQFHLTFAGGTGYNALQLYTGTNANGGAWRDYPDSGDFKYICERVLPP